MFALSWLITWYGHVLKDFATIVRLYDFFLATHPLMPVYFGAAVSLCVVSLDTAADCFYFIHLTAVCFLVRVLFKSLLGVGGRGVLEQKLFTMFLTSI